MAAVKEGRGKVKVMNWLKEKDINEETKKKKENPKVTAFKDGQRKKVMNWSKKRDGKGETKEK